MSFGVNTCTVLIIVFTIVGLGFLGMNLVTFVRWMWPPYSESLPEQHSYEDGEAYAQRLEKWERSNRDTRAVDRPLRALLPVWVLGMLACLVLDLLLFARVDAIS